MHLFDDDDAIQGGQALVCRIDAKVRWLLETYFLNQWIKDSWAVLAISLSESEASVVRPGDASRIWSAQFGQKTTFSLKFE